MSMEIPDFLAKKKNVLGMEISIISVVLVYILRKRKTSLYLCSSSVHHSRELFLTHYISHSMR